MMTNSPIQITEDVLLLQVAQKYKNAGFEVYIEPQSSDMPFDLGLYRPDLLVKKTDSSGYIVEVKKSTSQVSVERFREIAEMVAEHPGWRFLLVTGDDKFMYDQDDADQLLSLEEIIHRKEKSAQLITANELDAAFLTLWSAAEALMRRHAAQILLPIERFPPVSLIKHLYSQGELSIEQYDKAMLLVDVRNRLAHGFQTPELDKAVVELQALVDDLLHIWNPFNPAVESFEKGWQEAMNDETFPLDELKK